MRTADAFRPLSVVGSVALLVFFLVGCEAQRQAAANGIAGATALRQEIRRNAPHLIPTAGPILDGIESNFAAASDTQRNELPPPTWSPQEIREDPTGYNDDAKKREEQAGASWGLIAGYAATGAAILATILRTTGLGGPAGALLAGLLENATIKRKREDERTAARTGHVVVRCIEEMPDDATVSQLKKAVSKYAEPEEIATIHKLRKQPLARAFSPSSAAPEKDLGCGES